MATATATTRPKKALAGRLRNQPDLGEEEEGPDLRGSREETVLCETQASPSGQHSATAQAGSAHKGCIPEQHCRGQTTE